MNLQNITQICQKGDAVAYLTEILKHFWFKIVVVEDGTKFSWDFIKLFIYLIVYVVW